jgi:hypothetical protein
MKALRAPAMTLIEPPLFYAPSLATASGTQQGRIVINDNNGFIDPPLRQAIALERTACTVLSLGIEEAAVFDGPRWAQDAPLRVLQDVVLGVVTEAPQRHTAFDRFGLGWD